MTDSARSVSIEVAPGERLALPEIARFRYEAWKPSGDLGSRSCEESDWIDGHDAHGTHLLARDGGALAGALRFCVHPALREIPDFAFYPQGRRIRQSSDLPIGCLNRLVVAPGLQKMGIGGQLLEKGIGRLTEAGVSTIILSANPRVAGSLQRIGFIPTGEIVFDPLKPKLPLRFFLLRISQSSKRTRRA